MQSGILSKIKNAVVPREARVRTIPIGLYRGIRAEIDLRYNAQLYLGLWERETHAFIRQASQRARWCIDVGAGAGELSLLFARQPNVLNVIAIEPNASEVVRLRSAIALNDIPDGRVTVMRNLAGAGAGMTAIDALPVDRTLPGFLKIDVDGGEVDVLRSASNTLDGRRVHVLVETHSAALEAACIDLLADKGYVCKIIDMAWWRQTLLPEQRPWPHNRWLTAIPQAGA